MPFVLNSTASKKCLVRPLMVTESRQTSIFRELTSRNFWPYQNLRWNTVVHPRMSRFIKYCSCLVSFFCCHELKKNVSPIEPEGEHSFFRWKKILAFVGAHRVISVDIFSLRTYILCVPYLFSYVTIVPSVRESDRYLLKLLGRRQVGHLGLHVGDGRTYFAAIWPYFYFFCKTSILTNKRELLMQK